MDKVLRRGKRNRGETFIPVILHIWKQTLRNLVDLWHQFPISYLTLCLRSMISFVLAFCVHFHLYTALTKHYNNERVKNKNTFVLTPDSIITGCWSQLLRILQLGHSRQGVTLLTLLCCFSPQDEWTLTISTVLKADLVFNELNVKNSLKASYDDTLSAPNKQETNWKLFYKKSTICKTVTSRYVSSTTFFNHLVNISGSTSACLNLSRNFSLRGPRVKHAK